jgi:segregation and condensation protein A
VEATQPDVSALNGYQLRLPSFEGPFDVLLRLIERSQLAITDISLVAVTDQFLRRIAELGGAPPAVIAEFTTVGSRLVLLKSRSLLPRPPSADGEDDAASDLARELIEYRAVKAASMELAKRDATGHGAFGRAIGAVSAPIADAPLKLARHEPNALARAIRRRLSVTPSPRTLLTRKPIVTIREMAQRWLELVRGEANVTFHRFSSRCDDASELRTAFLAMLVLIRRRMIDADQHEPFGVIHIRLADPTGTISEASEFE